MVRGGPLQVSPPSHALRVTKNRRPRREHKQPETLKVGGGSPLQANRPLPYWGKPLQRLTFLKTSRSLFLPFRPKGFDVQGKLKGLLAFKAVASNKLGQC